MISAPRRHQWFPSATPCLLFSSCYEAAKSKRAAGPHRKTTGFHSDAFTFIYFTNTHGSLVCPEFKDERKQINQKSRKCQNVPAPVCFSIYSWSIFTLWKNLMVVYVCVGVCICVQYQVSDKPVWGNLGQTHTHTHTQRLVMTPRAVCVLCACCVCAAGVC